MAAKKEAKAQDVISEKIPVYMTSKASYTTDTGIEFTAKSPYQLMSAFEAENLMATTYDRFRYATAEEIKEYYSK
jgi:hypothetical protein